MPKLSQQQQHRARHLMAVNSYMTGCVDLIAYVQNDGQLSYTDFQILMSTVKTLELALQTWEDKQTSALDSILTWESHEGGTLP